MKLPHPHTTVLWNIINYFIELLLKGILTYCNIWFHHLFFDLKECSNFLVWHSLTCIKLIVFFLLQNNFWYVVLDFATLIFNYCYFFKYFIFFIFLFYSSDLCSLNFFYHQVYFHLWTQQGQHGSDGIWSHDLTLSRLMPYPML